jgi:hypothetical protein
VESRNKEGNRSAEYLFGAEIISKDSNHDLLHPNEAQAQRAKKFFAPLICRRQSNLLLKSLDGGPLHSKATIQKPVM